MSGIDVPRTTTGANSGDGGERRHSHGAMRHFVEEYTRAREASAMAEADHRHPARIRELYLKQVRASPGLSSAFSSLSPPDEHTAHILRVAVAFKLTAVAVVLGLIVTLALTA